MRIGFVTVSVVLVLLLQQSYALENNLVHVGDRVGIKYYITSNYAKQQIFATIIQIKDADGIVVHLSWLTGNLKPDQRLDIVQSWIPLKEGKYIVEIFVWECLDACQAFSPVRTMEITAI
ncbi:MAG: hypothetical protein QXU32_04305 [Nitrososphaerales archaeon]